MAARKIEICRIALNVEAGAFTTIMDTPPESRGLPLASRIATARALRGFTQGETTMRMREPITVAALSQIEAGKVRPTRGTLEHLADALEVPVDYFYTQWPAGHGDAPPAIYFRDLRATPARERRRAAAIALLLNDLVTAIEHYVRLPKLDLPELPAGSSATREHIDAMASELRHRWELGTGPIMHIVREIERKGIPVARLSLGHEKIDAFSVPFEQRPLLLLTNDKQNNYVRSRSDAAHELGHLVMHRGRGEQDRTIEQQAHSFAASFLYPKDAAIEELPRRLDGKGWVELAELKRRWGVSMASLVRRMRDLRLSTEDEYRNAMKFMSVRGWRTTEPGDRELGPPEAPLLLERCLRTIEVHNGITAQDLVERAHLPVADIMPLVEATHDKRPVIEL
ncbi:MAG: ImmA/IrrE family metallo-endopeptidase [Acidimicrobiaceae bacterium]|nr:ImmA/IrrE family metallo-endopeptidase [Acidimicrobiaceae bacterium]